MALIVTVYITTRRQSILRFMSRISSPFPLRTILLKPPVGNTLYYLDFGDRIFSAAADKLSSIRPAAKRLLKTFLGNYSIWFNFK